MPLANNEVSSRRAASTCREAIARSMAAVCERREVRRPTWYQAQCAACRVPCSAGLSGVSHMAALPSHGKRKIWRGGAGSERGGGWLAREAAAQQQQPAAEAPSMASPEMLSAKTLPRNDGGNHHVGGIEAGVK